MLREPTGINLALLWLCAAPRIHARKAPACSVLEAHVALVLGGVCRHCGAARIWAQRQSFAALRSGPGALLVSLLDGTLVSLDPLTGAELWAEPFDSGKPLIRSVPAEAPAPRAPPVGDPGEDPMAGNSLAAVFPGLDGALYAYADGGGVGAGESQPRGLQVRPRAASGCDQPWYVLGSYKGARSRARRCSLAAGSGVWLIMLAVGK